MALDDAGLELLDGGAGLDEGGLGCCSAADEVDGGFGSGAGEGTGGGLALFAASGLD